MGNSISQKNALIKFRKLLAHDDIHPHLDKILEFNCIPYFVSYLSDSFDPELQVCSISSDFNIECNCFSLKLHGS